MARTQPCDPNSRQVIEHVSLTLFDAVERYDDVKLLELARKLLVHTNAYIADESEESLRRNVVMTRNEDGQEDILGNTEGYDASRHVILSLWQEVFARLGQLTGLDESTRGLGTLELTFACNASIERHEVPIHEHVGPKQPTQREPVTLLIDPEYLDESQEIDQTKFETLDLVVLDDDPPSWTRQRQERLRATRFHATDTSAEVAIQLGAGCSIEALEEKRKDLHAWIDERFQDLTQQALTLTERSKRARLETLVEAACAFLLYAEYESYQKVAQLMWPEPHDELARYEAHGTGWKEEAEGHEEARRVVTALTSRARDRARRGHQLVAGGWRELAGIMKKDDPQELMWWWQDP